jgi:hypothetical protein
MIVISNSLVLAAPPSYQPNNPVIGWHNLVTPANVTASSEAADHPAVNLANPITAPQARWQATATSAQTVEVAIDAVDPIDYVAIARHNLGTAHIPVMVEGSINSGVDWSELVQEVLLPNDAPALFRFSEQAPTNVRLSLGSGDAAASIAVLYVGKLLTLQRRIYVGHVPMPYGRSATVVNGKSEGGDYLGRIITSEQTGTAVSLQNITPAWYRAEMDPFIKASKDTPFFFAWRPADYPQEIGFAWMTNDPQPKNQRPNGMMQIDLQMTGIAP